MGKKVTIKAVKELARYCCNGCVFHKPGVTCDAFEELMVQKGLQSCTKGYIYVIKEKK